MANLIHHPPASLPRPRISLSYSYSSSLSLSYSLSSSYSCTLSQPYGYPSGTHALPPARGGESGNKNPISANNSSFPNVAAVYDHRMLFHHRTIPSSSNSPFHNVSQTFLSDILLTSLAISLRSFPVSHLPSFVKPSRSARFLSDIFSDSPVIPFHPHYNQTPKFNSPPYQHLIQHPTR